MCLAVPAKLIRLNGDNGTVDLHGNELPVNTQLTPGVRIGDWLLVHAGFAIETINEHDAQQTFATLRDLAIAENIGDPK